MPYSRHLSDSVSFLTQDSIALLKQALTLSLPMTYVLPGDSLRTHQLLASMYSLGFTLTLLIISSPVHHHNSAHQN